MNTKKAFKNTWLITLFFSLMLLKSAHLSAHSADQASQSHIMKLVIEEALKQGVSPELGLAVAKVESDFQSQVVSSAGAIGVMQILPATGRGEFGFRRYELFDPAKNIYAGIAFLKQLHTRYGRLDIALSHYNGGSGVKSKSGRLRVIPATRPYVDKVLKAMRSYRNSPLIQQIKSEYQKDKLQGYTSTDYSYRYVSSLPIDERSRLVSELRALTIKNKSRSQSAKTSRTESVSPHRDGEAYRRARVNEWESLY